MKHEQSNNNGQQAAVAPAAPVAATPTVVVVSKQTVAFDALKKAVEGAGKTFEDKGMRDKLRVVTVNGVEVTIGAGGGFNIPAVSTYPKADLATMVKADELLAKQTTRRTKQAEDKAKAEQAEQKPEEPKVEPAAA